VVRNSNSYSKQFYIHNMAGLHSGLIGSPNVLESNPDRMLDMWTCVLVAFLGFSMCIPLY
jgi:hypothetical protein